MRRTRHILAALALALLTGCELLVRIDPNAVETGGAGGVGAGGVTTTSTTTSTTSTTTTTSTTSTTSTTTGNCSTAADCPPSTSNCASAACDPATHECSIVDVPDGGLAAASAQTAGDCKKVICDGAGNPMSADDDTNVPPSKEICITYTCSMGMQVTNYNAVACTENMGEVCGSPGSSAQGTCVACNVSTDCGPNIICLLNHCVTSSCTDMVQDGTETDVDCGGLVCLPCADHLKCLVSTDCQSDVCGPAMTCTPASCSDDVKNEGETDVDCGGPVCRPEGKLCGTGKTCAVPSDCQSLNCVGTTCVAATCFDGIQNEGETDLDCGGPNCAGTCATGKKCLIDHDCVPADGCQTSLKVCVSQCTDGHQDGNETDVDCGGGACPTCALTQKCRVDTDCASNACDGISFVCVSNQCADHRQDGVETDVDCGGADACARCGTNQKCLLDTDCIPADGCQNGSLLCVGQCIDHHQDGNETDVDCGGGACPTCSNGQMCKADADCTSDGCQTTTKLCVSQCADGHQDGNETDVDCGGTDSCVRCPVAEKCLVDTDCVSGACDAISLLCVANQCADDRKDGSETAVDCGGGTCPTCPVNEGCLVDTDCASSACDAISLLCVANQCADHQRDGQETDVDCGGGTCPGCAVGQKCHMTSDCLAGEGCDVGTKTCDASTCNDGVKDGSETGVDCGGPVCSPCGAGQGCGANTDCTSMACDFVSGLCVVSTCDDQRKDGQETDVDCGGPVCSPCAFGLGCLANTDCASMACDLVSGLCVASTCDDQRQDGNETGIDCGGSCSPCAIGQGCKVNGDCASNVCDFVSSLCVANTCDDQRLDPGETDVDCGGPCPPCAFGLGCLVDADCQSNACDGVSFICDATQCTDNQKDGNETGVDCGGGSYMGAPPCPTCPDAEPCLVDGDCTSSLCNAGVCTACVNNSDCPSDLCNAGVCMNCATSSDCPSDLCVSGACTNCAADAQCQADPVYGPGTLCVSGVCATGNCHTDADCGGQICGLSTPNVCGACITDGQCQGDPSYGAGTVCVSGACATGNCHTDADCSGQICGLSTPNTCGACATDAQCQGDTFYGAGTVCVSGACATGNCHTDADCSGQICGLSTPNTCGACTADAQCQADPSYGPSTTCNTVAGTCQ